MITIRFEENNEHKSIEKLKQLIDDDTYVSGAILRIAQVLSDEILNISRTGAHDERKQ